MLNLDADLSADEVALGELSPAEILAFESLCEGKTKAAAAKAAGVTRKTVYNWLEEGKPLQQAMLYWKAEMIDSKETQLLLLLDEAMTTVTNELRTGDFYAAVSLMQKMGMVPHFCKSRFDQIRLRKAEAQALRVEAELELAKYRLEIAQRQGEAKWAEEMKQWEETKPLAEAKLQAEAKPVAEKEIQVVKAIPQQPKLEGKEGKKEGVSPRMNGKRGNGVHYHGKPKGGPQMTWPIVAVSSGLVTPTNQLKARNSV